MDTKLANFGVKCSPYSILYFLIALAAKHCRLTINNLVHLSTFVHISRCLAKRVTRVQMCATVKQQLDNFVSFAQRRALVVRQPDAHISVESGQMQRSVSVGVDGVRVGAALQQQA
ncbi:hypothetical protein BpHYR1_039536 [Brachionus plicatilis]|uniref:Uncharacterized protein n=1 Tax=Brachionus plicatilis TaxID=10195 RepID=A0A3M7SSF7_BRAPC|nr:hypothetical protein BpHYR1_039536 [Brachionus plicatilis]